MALQRLIKAQWRPYCAHISRALAKGQRAELEVVSLDLGDRYETRWLPLFGIAYDPKSDVIEVALEGVDHLIEHPREMLVETTPRGIVAVEIVGADEARQIVKLREPLAVPPSGRQAGARKRAPRAQAD
jgi:hypothetical protein